MSNLKYRPDIDGLRSVAVLPVVFFHFGSPYFPGGFVGVDVFFVISGFLITSILLREIEGGQFSIIRFYERRVRRLLPALFAMIAVVLIVTALVFTPEDFKNTAQSSVAATLFASNILFFLKAGYFEAAAYSIPLLHTWSLAIEEQFYIVVPILLILLARFGQKPLIWIGGLTIVSLALSVLTTDQKASAAYYLLPWRAWELGIGALLACGIGLNLTNRILREAAAALGLALILYAVFTFSSSTAFPGSAALVPTLGAALILQAGRFGTSIVGRLLSMSVPVWIGRISYSLYLWHWPIIVFFVYWTMNMPDLYEGTGLFALSILLAALSLKFVEQPFRQPQTRVGRASSIFWKAGVTATIILAVSGVILITKGLPGRLPKEMHSIAALVNDRDPRAGVCFRDKMHDKTWLNPCIYGAEGFETAGIALWGDSHASALIPALDKAGKTHGVPVAFYAHNGCPSFKDFQVYWIGHDHDCTDFLDTTIPEIHNNPEIDTVVLTFRAQMYAHGWPDYGMDERGRRPLLIGSREGPLPDGSDRIAFFLDRLESTVRDLKDGGKEVVLVYPTPESGSKLPDTILRRAARGGQTDDLNLPREMFDARTARIIEGYDKIVAEHDVTAIRIDQEICGAEYCSFVFEDGTPIYRDSNHLNATAARRFASLFDTVFEGR